MKHIFIIAYTDLENKDDSLRFAQSLVLDEWKSHVEHKKIPFTSEVKVSFKTYSFHEYPDKELLRNWVWENFTNSFGDLCFNGDVYYDVDELIYELDVEKKLMEITVEEL